MSTEPSAPVPPPEPLPPRSDITRSDRAELVQQIEAARAYLQATDIPLEQAQALNQIFPAWVILQPSPMQRLADAGFSQEDYRALRRKIDSNLNREPSPPKRKLFADVGLSVEVLREKARQLAVWVLLCEAVIALLTVVLRAVPIQLVTFAVELALAFALQRNLRWARPVTIAVMLFAMVVTLAGAFVGLPPLRVVLDELPYVAVLLLLLGQPQAWRLTFARCVLIVIIFLTLAALPATIEAALNAR